MNGVSIGTCGYGYYSAPDGWKEKYESKLAAFADEYDLVELNKTFYSLPQTSTAVRWRNEAGEEFSFSLKAWQAITHPIDSPTWRDNKNDLSEDEYGDVGYFQPNKTVFDAWKRTREVAEALGAEVCVFQSPPSFDAGDNHEDKLRRFFSEIGGGDLSLAWEPRGDWSEYPERVSNICDDLGLVHVVDILKRDPLGDSDVLYTRLHGLNEDPYDYDYRYSDYEIKELASELRGLSNERESVYCLFNNYNMYEDAARLREAL